MEKVILIGDKECTFKSSAAVPRMYRFVFARDIFMDLRKMKKQMDIQKAKHELAKQQAKEQGLPEPEFESEFPLESLTMFENIAYIMHKHGDPSQPKDIDEWIEQFETFDIYDILPEILDMWNDENRTTSEAKKNKQK